MPSYLGLCQRLGVTSLVSAGRTTRAVKFRNTDELIVSPRRGHRPPAQPGREAAGTPPVPEARREDAGYSGYDGDMDDDYDGELLRIQTNDLCGLSWQALPGGKL